ncbi:MAG: hypothetical protein VB122_08625 [Erysipelotrichales bacterium]|nr:hypothetical protein [Erysipelotrichales bacterium]
MDKEDKQKKVFKQLIFYFDDKAENYCLETLSEDINKKIGEGIPPFSSFLGFLITDIQIPFLISSHFVKQKNRSIDYN